MLCINRFEARYRRLLLTKKIVCLPKKIGYDTVTYWVNDTVFSVFVKTCI